MWVLYRKVVCTGPSHLCRCLMWSSAQSQTDRGRVRGLTISFFFLSLNIHDRDNKGIFLLPGMCSVTTWKQRECYKDCLIRSWHNSSLDSWWEESTQLNWRLAISMNLKDTKSVTLERCTQSWCTCVHWVCPECVLQLVMFSRRGEPVRY